MKNEIVRKLTSLTLMTIMFAGGLTFAIPGMMPEASAAHNANLFVSAENSFSSNTFTGPMVIEVVINDSSIGALDDALGEPTVTVNGDRLRMLQATDGIWYGYFADRNQAQNADATQPGIDSTNNVDNSIYPGTGLNFGRFCGAADGTAMLGFSTTETEGIAIPGNATGGSSGNGNGGGANNGTDGTTAIATGACTGGDESGAVSALLKQMNVVRENKTLNRGTTNGGVFGNGEGIRDSNYWPFIQLYDFTPTGNAVVKYNKGGSVQTTTLVFDTQPSSGIKLSFDRTSYPANAQVHMTLQDFQLNIDPTDEDSWTWGANVRDTTTNKTVFYQLFNQTGGRDADRGNFVQFRQAASNGPITHVDKSDTPALGAQNLFGNLTTFLFEDNGVLTITNNTQGATTDVIELIDNKDSVLFQDGNQGSKGLRTNTIAHNNIPITVTETAPNSGIFEATDEDDNSLLRINSACFAASTGTNACRGTSATITYNDLSNSILVRTTFATLDMDETAIGGEWNSGETIPVTLVDNDANLNSRADEDLDVFDSNVKIFPAIKIGSPITLASLADAGISFNRGSSDDDGVVDDNNVRFNIVFDQNSGDSQSVDTFSDVARFGLNSGITVNSGDRLRFNLTTTGSELKSFLGNGTQEGSSTLQNGIFQFFNYDLRSMGTNSTANILQGASINFTIYDSAVGACARIASAAPTTNIGCSSNQPTISGLAGNTGFQGLIDITNAVADQFQGANTVTIDVTFTFSGAARSLSAGNFTSVLDIFRFGTSNDGDSATGTDRFNDAIYRLELEETGDNTGTFIGTVEYIMLNQLNINQSSTYTATAPISDDVTMIVHEDLTDEDSVRINYNDLGGDGTILPTADQQEAPTHSGVVTLDFDSYKVVDTATVTLTDQDLNVDSEVIDIFTVVTTNSNTAQNDDAYDQVGVSNFGQNSRGDNFGRLLDITFDDELWLNSAVGSTTCSTTPSGDNGLAATGFTLIETGIATGVFTGDFAIPSEYCARATGTGTIKSVTGTDLEVNYVDYRDASGEIIEVGDGAGVRANTGSVSLDRTVYPVPWGTLTDAGGASFAPTGKTPTTGTTTRSMFPIHSTGITTSPNTNGETLPSGDVTIHVRVNDPDFDISPQGSDNIAQNVTGTNYGPVKIMVQRGTSTALLATAGADVAQTGVITNGATVIGDRTAANKHTRELGPISEIAPDAGIFELDFTIRYTDGPLSTKCPTGTKSYTTLDGDTTTAKNQEPHRFFALAAAGTAATGQFAVNSTDNGRHCILQGDILTVEYTDPTDASGEQNTVTDSATFDLRNGVLQSDKSVYIIGSDMILTLIEPDFDRENDGAETYDLDLIEWDSDAFENTMGDLGGEAATFDPEPLNFRETGDSTGIFQIVIEIPNTLNENKLDRGEKIDLEYEDWGPSGGDYVGEDKQEIKLTVFTSNFGATVELDQKVYTWTDKVFITIVAPDHNFDSNLVDEIGETSDDKIIVQSRTQKLTQYKLVETGTDTGIFTGEVILAGFTHDADGKTTTGDSSGNDITSSSTASGSGPTDGKLSAFDDDGLTVSFEFNEDETVVGSALIRWNIGEVSWLEASYPASGTGVVRVVDPDMNLNPEAVDNFEVDTWSDSDSGGIDLTVTETNEATGIFEGTVSFTTTDESSGHRLRVSEGDTITAEYEDNTLPDPYTRADELDITGTSIIGTIVPPLERAPASNARVVDAFGNSLTSVSVDQQVQVAADLANGQDREQSFAYLVQIQDENGVTVSLAWITGSLSAGQSFSPALSWIPGSAGTYTATVFVWESVDNPTALSPTVTTSINVS